MMLLVGQAYPSESERVRVELESEAAAFLRETEELLKGGLVVVQQWMEGAKAMGMGAMSSGGGGGGVGC